jgi:hypothetical protein
MALLKISGPFKGLNMHLLRLVLMLFTSFSPVVNAQVWVEADGESSVRLKNQTIAFFSIGDNFYFDSIFLGVLSGKDRLSICIGYPLKGEDKPEKCISGLKAVARAQNGGDVRSLHINLDENRFIGEILKYNLSADLPLLVSLDDGKVYSSHLLGVNDLYSEEALKILKPPKERSKVLRII